METYHLAWLSVHPERTPEWLKERLADGFHVHHVDGDHYNDDPANLLLVDGIDHLRLHSGKLAAGIKWWRSNAGRKGAAALAAKRVPLPVVEATEPAEPSGYRPVLSPEQVAISAGIIARGGSFRDAAQAVDDGVLDWRSRLKAVKREVA